MDRPTVRQTKRQENGELRSNEKAVVATIAPGSHRRTDGVRRPGSASGRIEPVDVGRRGRLWTVGQWQASPPRAVWAREGRDPEVDDALFCVQRSDRLRDRGPSRNSRRRRCDGPFGLAQRLARQLPQAAPAGLVCGDAPAGLTGGGGITHLPAGRVCNRREAAAFDANQEDGFCDLVPAIRSRPTAAESAVPARAPRPKM